eukprot:jgi/Botrbrau1/13491/Bobra.0082s0087.1
MFSKSMATTKAESSHKNSFVSKACESLNLLGVRGISPAVVKQASLNEGQGRDLWRALHDFVLIAISGFPSHHVGRNLTSFWNIVEQEELQDGLPWEGVEMVKEYLHGWGYPDVKFFKLSRSTSETRSLLLALAWMMAHFDVFGRALDLRLSALPVMAPLPPYPQDSMESAEAREAGSAAAVQAKAVKDYANLYLQSPATWRQVDEVANAALSMLGRVRMKLGQVAAAQEARAKQVARSCSLQRDLREAVSPKSRGDPLSLYEMGLALHPDKALAHQRAAEAALEIVEECRRCEQNSAAFFEWAADVLDLEMSSRISCGASGGPQVDGPEQNVDGPKQNFQIWEPGRGLSPRGEHITASSTKDLAAQALRLNAQLTQLTAHWDKQMTPTLHQRDQSRRPASLEPVQAMLRESTEAEVLIAGGCTSRPLPADVTALIPHGPGLRDQLREQWEACRTSPSGVVAFKEEAPVRETLTKSPRAASHAGRPLGGGSSHFSVTGEVSRIQEVALDVARRLAKVRAGHKQALGNLLSQVLPESCHVDE